MRFGLLATFVSAVAIITWDELKNKQRFPHPEVYVHAAVVWAILGVVSDLGAPDIAALFGLGLLLSMLYIYVKPTTGRVLKPAQ
jgi:hypothetical protein